MTNTALDAALDQAAAAAESAPTNTALATQTGGVPATQAGGLSRPSLDDMADNAGISVDAYITFKFEGMKIGNGKLFDSFKAVLDLTEAVPIFQVRATRGGNTQFIKSYDGVTCSTGENFQQKISHLQATNDTVTGPYSTVELPLLLLEDIEGATKGQRVGITPPMTGTDAWNAFYKMLREKGLNTSKVEVEIVHVPRTNRNKNEWGICDYVLIGEAK